jgi:outer membrane protein OmpA-like peptidoglycan-associated protein
MTSTKRLLRHPLAGALPLVATLPLVVLLPGCATDPNTGAQSIAGIKVSDDPCAKTATVVGGVLGAVAGAVVTSSVTKNTDARVLGTVAGGGIGAAIGYNVDQRRCALFAIAKAHGADVTVASVIVPKGDLPPAATVAATDTTPAAATPFTASPDTATAGLSVTLRDTGKQFAIGSDKLTPEAESLFREIADQYSYPKQQAKLSATSTDDEKAAVEALKTKRILLVGHTDDTGGTTDNANLSERRAAAVARVFQAEGVPAANLYFQGAGETLPVADNHTEAGRAANRRVEIVDVSDDAAFHKYLDTRRQTLAFYRASDTPLPDTPPVAPVVAKGKRAPKPSNGFVDFGGVPAATLTSAPDFAPGTVGGGPEAGNRAFRPIVPTCNADRPRAANSVKSLATQKDLPMSDYVPGLYNTSWSDTVNGNLIGLTNVDVPRDGGAISGKPTLLIWKNYNPKKKMPPADFTASPDVNIYRGSHAILYRVFVGGPMKCMDVWFPYTDTGESRNSSLFYDRQQALYVSTFELKSLSSGAQ